MFLFVFNEHFLILLVCFLQEVGEKRSSDELGEKHEVARKRVKMRDLDDVIQSEGNSCKSSNFLSFRF